MTKRILILNNWIIPYLRETQFLRKDKGERIWVSIYARGRVPYQPSRKLFLNRRLGFPFQRLWKLCGDYKGQFIRWFDLARGEYCLWQVMQGQPCVPIVSQRSREQLREEFERVWLEGGNE